MGRRGWFLVEPSSRGVTGRKTNGNPEGVGGMTDRRASEGLEQLLEMAGGTPKKGRPREGQTKGETKVDGRRLVIGECVEV